jgi:hypothetical protein
MINLPEAPARIKRLPKDERGYPVPKFVHWESGKPDFRIIEDGFRARAFRTGLCWICGDPLGQHRIYAIGPMCVINRVTMEPPSHRDCAEFAASACPFLVRPRQKRNEKGFTGEELMAGVGLKRNPGCTCLYETRDARRFSDGNGSWLIRLGEPTRVDWWAEGRTATRAEIQASIDSGYPLLLGPAMDEGQEAVDELTRLTRDAFKLLPAA